MNHVNLVLEYRKLFAEKHGHQAPDILHVDGWYVSPSWFESVEEDGMIRKIEALKKELVA